MTPLRLDSFALRLLLALALSLALHSALVWGPLDLSLPTPPAPPPILAAKLAPLPPLPSAKPSKRSVHRAPSPPAPAPVTHPPASEPTEPAVQDETSIQESLGQAPPAPPPPTRPPLPARAQLTFAANKGTGNFKIGEVRHTLEIHDGRYVLESVTETVGLAKLIKTYKLTQYSSGIATPQGLQPEQFFEDRSSASGLLRNTVEFDLATMTAHFSHGGEQALPQHTQDVLSILYQFPALLQEGVIRADVSNGRKIERYEFDSNDDEDLPTSLGTLRTLHLSKRHQANEEGLEIWLAHEYRLLPVKMRIIERNGEISGEIVITDIRAEFDKETQPDADH